VVLFKNELTRLDTIYYDHAFAIQTVILTMMLGKFVSSHWTTQFARATSEVTKKRQRRYKVTLRLALFNINKTTTVCKGYNL